MGDATVRPALTEEESAALRELELVLEESIDTLWKCSVLVDEFSDADAQPAFRNYL